MALDFQLLNFKSMLTICKFIILLRFRSASFRAFPMLHQFFASIYNYAGSIVF